MLERIRKRRRFTPEEEARIVAAIREAESGTSGEVRVHVEGRSGPDVLAAARKRFVQLGMDRTAQRNGVLLHVAVLDRRFAVLGDEGIHAQVGVDYWESVRDALAARLAAGDLVGGIEEAVRSIGRQLAGAFPRTEGDANELPDSVSTDDDSP